MNRHLSRPCDARPNRAARRFAFSVLRRAERRQRRGQALILAVLVMLMIALVSAGFLVVVSGNLNQTARVADKSRAVEAARSGLRFVNEQLTYSKLGENWRPGFKTTGVAAQDKALLAEGESLMPQPGDLSYNLYYTSVERANGWAGTFAKFPDPLAPRSDAPQYLARVQRIPGELDAGDPDATDASKQGALKITIIGLSPDDPAAFHKSVAYKGGQSAPVGRFMRTVTNWDFKNKVVPSATANYNNTTQLLELSNTKGTFPAVPFSVVIGDAGSADLKSAVVDRIETTGELHIANEPFGKALTGVRVELAAQLGSSLPLGVAGTESALDYNGDGTIATDKSENISLDVSTPTSAGSARVNGGLALTGAVSLPALDANAGETVRVSGLLVQNAPTTDSKATVSTSAAPTTPLALATGSNDANFPGAGVSLELVSDGADRLQNSPAGARLVAPFSPPDFASGAGVVRYRELTRDSNSTVTGQEDAANYGFGEGLYINNPSDRERVWDTTLATPKLRDMTQAELVRMWLSRQADGTDDTSLNFNRAAAPALATATNASLEEQHLRGWVGPDEFRARGALVELFNEAQDPTQPVNALTNPIVPKVAITLDSRSDNSTVAPNNAFGPVAAKAWRDASGAVQEGVYRRVFAWPANGVIFAEGNVRVRGEARDVPRSLTIVSQNNIYIDGSLGVTAAVATPPKTSKLLLLARKNVIANPTAAVQRLDAQTVVPTAQTLTVGTAANLTVANSTEFRVGDVVETVAAGAPTAPKVIAVVTAVPDATSLSLSSLSGTAVDANDTLRARRDTIQNGRPVLTAATDAIQRRLQVSNPTPTNLRLGFYHNADRAPALTVETEAAPTLTKPTAPFAFLSNNRTAANSIAEADKKLQGDYTQPSAGSDMFPASGHSSEADATTYDLAARKAAMEGTTHSAGSVGWRYKVTPTAPTTLPAFYLAGFGGRGDFGAPVPSGTIDFRKDISSGAYQVPLATSVQTILNGDLAALPGIDTPSSTAPRFGFSPLYKATTPPPDLATEDITTNDQGFYQGTTTGGIPDAEANNATLDSRRVPVTDPGQHSLVLRQSGGLVANATLPTYRAGNMRLESVDASTGAVAPGYIMDIKAFVYAQSGSWFVIPTAPADPLVRDVLKLRGDESKSYFDLNSSGTADAGEYVDADANSTFSAGDGADLNRDGQPNKGEATAYLRYARANYRLNFVGAIAENQTALVNPAGTIPGAVQAWSNSWASYNAGAGALSDRVAGVNYTFDPAYANGSLFGDPGFVMPQSNELTYVD